MESTRLAESDTEICGLDIYQFKGHIGSAFHGIFTAAGGTEAAIAAERDKLKLFTVGTAIHDASGSL